MARAEAKEGVLRECPVCETPLDEAKNLGLRDFSWVNEELGNRLGMMDFDAVLSQLKTGRMLVLELKPKRKPVSTGARLTFATLVRAGYDAWIIWDQGNGRVKLGVCNDKGRTPVVKEMTKRAAAVLVRKWWEAGLDA
jgi:hypothetical protein